MTFRQASCSVRRTGSLVGSQLQPGSGGPPTTADNRSWQAFSPRAWPRCFSDYILGLFRRVISCACRSPLRPCLLTSYVNDTVYQLQHEHDFAAIHGCHLGYARSARLWAANVLTDTVTGVDALCFAVGSAAEVANLSCRWNGNTGRSGRRWHGCVRASERVRDIQLVVGLAPSILSCTL